MQLTILAYALGLLLGVLLFIELGRRIGRRQLARTPQGFQTGTGTVDAAVFGLMGLLIAFTFSGAATRWELRRQLIVEEANAIGTAYLRLNLLPPASQPALQEAFRNYLRSRLAVYQTYSDIHKARPALKESGQLQQEIWRQVTHAAMEAGNPAVPVLVLQPINEMFDITTTRTAAVEAHLPSLVFALLAISVLVSSLLVGYNTAASPGRNWTHMVSYAFLVTTA